MKKYAGDNHEGEARTSPYGLSRLAPETSLVDVAREIEHADNLIGHTTSSKLRLIADQIRHLQAEARTIVAAAKRDLDLHRASCSFSRTPGQIYHLYQRPNDALYWSLLSPLDWGGSPPHDFRGSYRLEPDQSWTAAEEVSDDDDPLAGTAIVGRLRQAEPDDAG